MTTYDDRGGGGQQLAETWSNRVWPVMAGVLTGVGLLAVWRMYGVLGGPAAFLGLWFFFSISVFGVLADGGFTLRRSVRIGRLASLSLLVLIGLLALFPVWGLVAAGVCALTSPWVLDRVLPVVRRLRRRGEHRRATAPAPLHPTPGSRHQAAVDRAFEKIVTDLDWRDP